MRTLLFLLILAAGSAGAQQPPSEPEKKPRPLNLRIDDAPRAGPRITFETKEDKTAPTNLPGLGAGARTAEEQRRRPLSSSPYPTDTAPGR
jgi:hypothetical protein